MHALLIETTARKIALHIPIIVWFTNTVNTYLIELRLLKVPTDSHNYLELADLASFVKTFPEVLQILYYFRKVRIRSFGPLIIEFKRDKHAEGN